MSETVVALNADSRSFSTCRRLLACICPCLAANRKIAPTNEAPVNSKFIQVGKKTKRLIRVLHVEPASQRGLELVSHKHTNPARLPAAADTKDYDSDSSGDEYWFTKWTVPFQTVKKLQRESLRRRNLKSGILSRISIRLSSRRKSKRLESSKKHNDCDIQNKEKDSSLSTYANALAMQVIKEAQNQIWTKSCIGTKAGLISTTNGTGNGIVNPSFDGSASDPDAVQNVEKLAGNHSSATASAVNRKPLLFFIHGAGESSDYWTNVIEYFSALDYEALALDLLGHGFSTAPRKENLYSFPKLFDDVLRVFDDHVTDGRKSIIIGHGYGCSFAVKLIRQRSSSVCLVVLLSSGGPTPLAPSFQWRSELKLPFSLVDCLLRPFLSCGLKRKVLYGPRGKNSIHRTENLRSLPSYVVSGLAKGQSWSEGDVAYHRKIHVPTLLVHGMKDNFVSLVEMCEMERTIPRAFLEVIPEAGHDIPSDSPRALCKMMRKFIENWER